MSWRTCPACGADGYRIRADPTGYRATCPCCQYVLATAPTRTDCLMRYTKEARA